MKQDAKAAITRNDWSLDANIPTAHAEAVMRSCLAGTIDLKLKGPHPNVLLCALPKSASLHVTQLLALSLDLKNHKVGFGGRGGHTYYPRLLMAKYAGAPTISHSHNPCDLHTRALLENLDLRPVVLTRNLLDALVSRCDMTLRARQVLAMAPAAFERFKAASRERQLDTTIDLFASTYISFATSWFEHRDDPDFQPVFASFEEMRRDEVAMVERIADELGLPCDHDRVVQASRSIREAGGVHLSKTGKGRPGRGREQLNDAQIERLRGIARRLGCTDEEFLGFPLEAAPIATT